VVLIVLLLAHSELSVELPVNLLPQSRNHNPLDEELVAKEEHHKVNDQCEAEFGQKVPGIREDLPGLLEHTFAVLVAVTVSGCDDE